MTDALTGRLLVAVPGMFDPNFDRTVVLVLEHTDDGAVGVVLNRPSETEVAISLPGLGAVVAAAEPAVVFVGGPVVPEGALAIAEVAAGEAVDGFRAILGGIGLLDLNRLEVDAPTAAVTPAVRRARVFAGHAGWAAGQLEGEIEAEGWFVVDALPDDAFASDPARLWRTVMARQPGRLAWFSNCPPDPSVN